ncbi:MAG: DUF4271 domain-containing protein [Muribaculaceae bacterium]|nr:DUF4271 domain-containing protein [Muribaculaceae bacterium]
MKQTPDSTATAPATAVVSETPAATESPSAATSVSAESETSKFEESAEENETPSWLRPAPAQTQKSVRTTTVHKASSPTATTSVADTSALVRPPLMAAINDIAVADSVAVTDTIAVPPGELNEGIILTPPPRIELKGEGGQTLGMSFILLGLFVIFATVCLRFKNNVRYLQVLWRDLIEIRMRHNVFDDTVRETSFLVLLNLLWCASAGVLLHSLVTLTWNNGLTAADSRPPLPEWSPLPMAICIGVATCYTLFMLGALWITGMVFTDRGRAALWVKGYSAAQGLLSFIFFPLALLCQSYPDEQMTFLYVAGGALAIAKLIFIWKGLRIFFNQFSSWVLFLYYLCSLEIVPLILTYIAAMLLCALMV